MESRFTPITLIVAVFSLLLFAPYLRADDAFYSVPLHKLTFTDGALPAGDVTANQYGQIERVVLPYVSLDGSGEAYVRGAEEDVGSAWSMYGWSAQTGLIGIRASKGAPVAGLLFVPAPDGTKHVALKFTIAPDAADAPDARNGFLLAKAVHYERLLALGAPGTAYFRHQRDAARRELGPVPHNPNRNAWRTTPGDSLNDTYNLFLGGRALSENLQLHRTLPDDPPAPPADDEKPVPVSSITGITVREFDWSAKLTGAPVNLDPLAKAIPLDQHALFFPSFDALMRVLDETTEDGLPVFRGIYARSEDARLVQRYEKQLCLQRTALTRMLGPSVIKSVAVTGSDPYFPTGTDVAVIFEPVSAAGLRTLLLSQFQAATAMPGVKASNGKVNGVAYDAVASEDRSVCAYLATVGETVVVTNSLEQLKRLGGVVAGSSLAMLDEYKFFRTRYPRTDADESAFVYLSDATIRRWCSAEWRIGASRRLRAAAILADVTAAHAGELAAGVAEKRPVTSDVPMRTIGDLTIGPSGAVSSVYGRFTFITPIAELGITEVAPDEAASYERWCNAYQRNWRWAFDPIAIRLTIADDRIAADMSVMPLIMNTTYNTWLSFTRGASIPAGGGDPHDALVHAAFAMNLESQAIGTVAGMLRGMSGNPELDALGWLGKCVAVYADPDPFWNDLLQTANPDRFLEKEIYRMPLGVHAEVGSALKLTAFLTALRGMAEQSAPGMLLWETKTYNDQPYVKVGLSDKARVEQGGGGFDKLTIYYAALPRALLISPNEAVLKRALDRQAGRGEKAPAGEWLGSSMALRFKRDAVSLLPGPGGEFGRNALRSRAWANIWILNEWKRLFPDKDPLKVHEELWGTRILCPGGGSYVWDEKFRTMSSTVYGNPAAPRDGPIRPLSAEGFTGGDLGVTFEDQGLRGKGVLRRDPKAPKR